MKALLLSTCLLFLLSCATIPSNISQTQTSTSCTITEERLVSVGGIKQWIAIRGQDCNAPILLIVHGGPWSTTSHYTNSHFNALEQHFILVHWDQRGAGKTFAHQLADQAFDDFLMAEPLSVDQLVADGLAVSSYLLKRFNRKKLILRGGSWGAFLAVNMIHKAPELFHAYVGHAQLVNAHQKLNFGYQKSIQIAEETGQSEILNALKSLSPPPYDHPRKYGQLTRFIKYFEQGAPTSQQSHLIDGYASEHQQKLRFLADDYSWMQFVGFQRLGIQGMQDKVDLTSLGVNFEVPIFVFQGAKDLTTPAHFTRDYINKIQAPVKQYIEVEDAGHEPSDRLLQLELTLLTEKIKPLVGDK